MTHLSATQLTTDSAVSLGTPRYSRRLSDKILAAFTHAYAIGEVEIADRLRSAIEANEAESGDKRQKPSPTALMVDSWVSFIEARNRYTALNSGGKSSESAIALEEMKEAYMCWSAANGS